MDCNGLDLHFLKLDCVCSFHYKRALLAEVSPAMPIYVWKSCDVEWSFPLKRNRMITHYSLCHSSSCCAIQFLPPTASTDIGRALFN